MTSAARRAARSVASRDATSERRARTLGATTSIAAVVGNALEPGQRGADGAHRARLQIPSERGDVDPRLGRPAGRRLRRCAEDQPPTRRGAERPQGRPGRAEQPGHELAVVVGGLTGQPVVRRQVGDPVALAVSDAQPDRRLEGVTPRPDRAGGIGPRQLLVALADQAEGVVVVAHPDVQPVLLDAAEGAA